jgi:hypothetical protein
MIIFGGAHGELKVPMWLVFWEHSNGVLATSEYYTNYRLWYLL